MGRRKSFLKKALLRRLNRAIRTRVEQQQELEADVVDGVELELLQPLGHALQLWQGGVHPQQGQSHHRELLAVGHGDLLRQPVVQTLVQVVQDQHVRPGLLQELHLVVHLNMGERLAWLRRL